MSKPKSERGCIVETYDGKIGRTFNEKNTLGEKVIVYLEAGPNHYSPQGTLYTIDKIKVIGYID